MRRLVDERDVSVIVATHDPLLIEMGDRVIGLRDGVVVPEEDEVVPASAPAAG